MRFTFHAGVRLPLVEPSSEPFAVELGALLGAKVDAVGGTCVTVAKLQSSRGTHTKLASMRWSGMQSSRLETCLWTATHRSLESGLLGSGSG